MNAEEIASLCTQLIVPLRDKIDGLLDILASKNDLQTFIVDIETKIRSDIESSFETFNRELESRDLQIKSLQTEVEKLKLSRIQNASLYEEMKERIENLESRQNYTFDSSAVLSQSAESNISTTDTNSVPDNDNESNDIEDNDESVQQNEKETLDFVCLGDSIVKWLNIDQINPNSKNLKVCKPGAKIGDIRNELIELNERYDISNLYLHIGCNEIPSKRPLDVAIELANLLSEVSSFMPSTKVYLSAILPKTANNYLRGINMINYLICNMCNTLGYVLVQHPSFSSNGCINWDLYAHDGIHLNTRGVSQLASDIRRLASSFI